MVMLPVEHDRMPWKIIIIVAQVASNSMRLSKLVKHLGVVAVEDCHLVSMTYWIWDWFLFVDLLEPCLSLRTQGFVTPLFLAIDCGLFLKDRYILFWRRREEFCWSWRSSEVVSEGLLGLELKTGSLIELLNLLWWSYIKTSLIMDSWSVSVNFTNRVAAVLEG
jgi:hypothetical protein